MNELLKRSEEAARLGHTWTGEDHKLVKIENKTTEAYEKGLLQIIEKLEKQLEEAEETGKRG